MVKLVICHVAVLTIQEASIQMVHCIVVICIVSHSYAFLTLCVNNNLTRSTAIVGENSMSAMHFIVSLVTIHNQSPEPEYEL